MMTPSTGTDFTYIFSGGTNLSLDPKDSDYTTNQTVLDSLIGTLVKYGVSGRLEPYLAERWSITADKKQWSFFLREGLRAEDGQPINALTFAQSLKNQLRQYAKVTNVLEFEKLKGWKKFKDSDGKNDLEGIYPQGELSLVLEFAKAPNDLIEFLRMPYFGFYSAGNFDGNSWKDPRKIISSGAYALESYVSERHIVVKKRPEWFSQSDDSVDRVIFRSLDIDKEDIGESNRKIVLLGTSPKNVNGFQFVKSMPTRLTALVLSPYRKTLFSKVENRRLFLEKLRDAQNDRKFESSAAQLSDTFYPGLGTNPSARTKNSVYETVGGSNEMIISLARLLDESERTYIFESIESALEGTSLKLVKKAPEDISGFNKSAAHKFYDIRIARVDIGSPAANSTIKMMFCSDMGVTFPDPSGAICSLVEKTDEIKDGAIDDSYVQEFNRILYDEAVVVPLFHSGLSWLYSNDIDPSSIAPIPSYPRIEHIRFR